MFKYKLCHDISTEFSFMSIDLFVLQKEIADIAAEAGEKIMGYFHDEQNWQKEKAV